METGGSGGGAVAHLEEGITEGGVAVFGEVAYAVGPVAGAIGDGVIAGEGPDLGGAIEAVAGSSQPRRGFVSEPEA